MLRQKLIINILLVHIVGFSIFILYSSTMKVDAEAFSETSGIAYQNTLCRNQEITTHSDINSRGLPLMKMSLISLIDFCYVLLIIAQVT